MDPIEATTGMTSNTWSHRFISFSSNSAHALCNTPENLFRPSHLLKSTLADLGDGERVPADVLLWQIMQPE